MISFAELKRKGILGINRRIGEFILPENPRKFFPRVDSKLLAARLAEQKGIAVPRCYFSVSSQGELRGLLSGIRNLKEKEALESFVVKPDRGAKGNGVLIVESMNWPEDQDRPPLLKTTRQRTLDWRAFLHYCSDILGGLYSLNGSPDSLIVQELLKLHPSLEKLSFRGIPDLRVIVFRGRPVMAMLRLPTKGSGGRANLHQGAVGCGVDMQSGRIIHAVISDRRVTHHPDTHEPLEGFVVPHWKECLEMAARCYEVVGLGYLGIDIVLDPTRGPLLLEMNARPGLSIQSANRAGLLPILQQP